MKNHIPILEINNSEPNFYNSLLLIMVIIIRLIIVGFIGSFHFQKIDRFDEKKISTTRQANNG